jgi:hypothetical protein
MLSADWEVTYSILPKLHHSERVGDYFFNVEADACRVTVAFSNELQPDEHGSLNVDRVDACAQAETHRLCIEELMLIRNVYQQVTRPVEVSMLDEGPQLLNKEDLQRQGIDPKRHVSASIASAFRAIQVGDSIAESQVYWQKASYGRMSSHTTDVLRIERWLQSSENDDAYGTSFVHLWIAFNAIWKLGCVVVPCEGCHSHCGDFSSMERAVPHVLGSSSKAVMNSISADAKVISQEEWVHGTEKHERFLGRELRIALDSSEKDPLRTIVVALECAYVFRCRLFHEAPEPADVLRWTPVFNHLLRQVTTASLFNLMQL